MCDRWERRRGGMGVVGGEEEGWNGCGWWRGEEMERMKGMEYMVRWNGGVKRRKREYSPKLNCAR